MHPKQTRHEKKNGTACSNRKRAVSSLLHFAGTEETCSLQTEQMQLLDHSETGPKEVLSRMVTKNARKKAASHEQRLPQEGWAAALTLL